MRLRVLYRIVLNLRHGDRAYLPKAVGNILLDSYQKLYNTMLDYQSAGDGYSQGKHGCVSILEEYRDFITVSEIERPVCFTNPCPPELLVFPDGPLMTPYDYSGVCERCKIRRPFSKDKPDKEGRLNMLRMSLSVRAYGA